MANGIHVSVAGRAKIEDPDNKNSRQCARLDVFKTRGCEVRRGSKFSRMVESNNFCPVGTD